MNHTTNYQLNQWAPEDRILRADFNTDNAKIDAALAALRARVEPVLIREIVTTEDAVHVKLDVTDIDWSQWREVYVDAEIGSSTGSSGGSVSIYANRTSSITDYIIGTARSTSSTAAEKDHEGVCRMTLFCGNDPRRRITSLCVGGTCGVYSISSVRFRGLELIGYYHKSENDYSILAGSQFRIWGVR